MSGFTKVTIIGSARKATLVVPTDTPIGTQISDIASLLQEPHAADNGPLTLVSPLGIELNQNLTLEDQQVLDGAVLQLIRTRDIPPPPEVTDVTDVVAELHDTQLHPWNANHRNILGAIVAGLLTALTISALQESQLLVGGITLAASILFIAVLGRRNQKNTSVVVTGIAIGTALPVANQLATYLPGTLPEICVSALTFIGLSWIILGSAFGIGRRSLAATIGASTGLTTAGIPLILSLIGIDTTLTAAIISVIVVVSLAALPGIALASSGVASLDDRVIAGALPDRTNVSDAVSEAYRIFSWAIYALAPPAAAAAAWLISSGKLWSVLVGAATILILLTRTRIMPLAVQAWPLWLAAITAGIIGLIFIVGLPEWIRTLCVAAGILLTLTLTLTRPSAQARIRLRSLGDQLETLAALSLIPSLIGMTGVYEFMLEVFA